MSKVMDDLHEDHRNVAMILDVLSEQLDAVHAADRGADFELMYDIMIYMTHYPDSTHHPKEDLMFERMAKRTEEGRDAVVELEREHVALAEKGAKFRDMLQTVVDGALVEREVLETTGRDYAEFLRYHMTKEDQTVFPLAESTLQDEDWNYVQAAFDEQQDPLFGPIVAREYAALFEHIKKNIEK